MQRFITVLVVVALAGCSADQDSGSTVEPAMPQQSQLTESDDLHQSLLTLDTHIDIPVDLATTTASSNVDSDTGQGVDPGVDPGTDSPMQVDFPKMRSGGLDSGFFIVYVAQGAVTEDGYTRAYEAAQAKFAGIERMLEKYPEEIELARSPAEVRELVKRGKLVAMIGVENAYPLGERYQYLQEFYDRGVRYVSLTHFGHNHFADSSSGKGEFEGTAEPEHGGVSELGLRLIDQLNRFGIMIDVSHTSIESTLQAVEASAAPVIASHSGVRALHDNKRNLTDEEIIAIADGGGVVQVVAFDTYMREQTQEEKDLVADIRAQLGLTGDRWYEQATQAQMREIRDRRAELHSRWPRATVSTLVDHIEYVVNLVGIDHVGISSDFGGGGGVRGWDHAGQTPAVTAELLERGYSMSEIQKIWSENLLRVWTQVEKTGVRLQEAASGK